MGAQVISITPFDSIYALQFYRVGSRQVAKEYDRTFFAVSVE